LCSNYKCKNGAKNFDVKCDQAIIRVLSVIQR
jgi:hypothetical protein